VEFVTEQLLFTGEDSPMANLMLSDMVRSLNSSVPSGSASGKVSPLPSTRVRVPTRGVVRGGRGSRYVNMQ
jgi:hypothetical protein